MPWQKDDILTIMCDALKIFINCKVVIILTLLRQCDLSKMMLGGWSMFEEGLSHFLEHL